jgi:hypothetical protein
MIGRKLLLRYDPRQPEVWFMVLPIKSSFTSTFIYSNFQYFVLYFLARKLLVLIFRIQSFLIPICFLSDYLGKP